MALENPKLRAIEAIPIMMNDEMMVGLRDPHDLAGTGQMIAMSREAFAIMTLLDGTHSLTDIQTYLTRMSGGVLFPLDELQKMVTMLDTNFLLESGRYHEFLQQYQANPVRDAILPGRNLPADPAQLKQVIADIMCQAKQLSPSKPLKALIAPHIDIYRAQAAFAEAYNAVDKNCQAEIFVVFGTAHHAYPETRFAFTRKGYATPWGVVPNSRDFLNLLDKKLSPKIYQEEILHKGEHSIEFAALFLQHTVGQKRPIHIVPILTGPFSDCIEEEKSPLDVPEIHEAFQALDEIAQEIGTEKICYIASGDMSHVGRRFGDEPPDELQLSQIQSADMDCLQAVAQCDAQLFFEKLTAHRNQFRVCGLSCFYSVLAMLRSQKLPGQLLRYDQSYEDDTGSVVTFASVSFA